MKKQLFLFMILFMYIFFWDEAENLCYASDSINPIIATASTFFGFVIAFLTGWFYWISRISKFEKEVKVDEKSPKSSYKKYCSQSSKTLMIIISILVFFAIFFISYVILGGGL